MNPITLMPSTLPWIILAAVLAVGAAGVGGFIKGETFGADKQKVTDQKLFDDINKKLTDQKTEANAKYRELQNRNIAVVAERDNFKTQLEEHYAADQKVTASHQRELASTKLQFRTAQAPRCGTSSGSAPTAPGDTPSVDASTVIQLPDALATDIRLLTFDADTLNDNYKKCYAYANKKR